MFVQLQPSYFGEVNEMEELTGQYAGRGERSGRSGLEVQWYVRWK